LIDGAAAHFPVSYVRDREMTVAGIGRLDGQIGAA